MFASASHSGILLGVGLTAAAWCALHSLLISPVAASFWRALLGRQRGYSRLIYNLFSLASFFALWWWWRSLPHSTMFAWQGIWLWLRVTGLVAAGFIMLAGARVYDNDHFLGLAQIRKGTNPSPDQPTQLQARGILLHMRHPYYIAALLVVVFGSHLTDVNLVWRSVFLVYLVVGTWLEERKLLAEFGQQYAQYRQAVPMFWPRWTPAPWPVRTGRHDAADRRKSTPRG